MTHERFEHRLISASAGSGKTHRLTNRYLSLLAAGVEPDVILATTFTRKAAGEILDRVLSRLAKAASGADACRELAQQIHVENAAPRDFVGLLRRMLRSLHRVRIGTLDSFYISLARSFSLEIGLPPGWRICEEGDDEVLQRDGLERLLEQRPDDILRFLYSLNKGDANRSVYENLREVIGVHHECFRCSERCAWECLSIPELPDEAMVRRAVEQLRSFDFSVCGHKGFLTARDKDVSNFEAGNSINFLGGGLAAKVAAGEPTYFKKQIPEKALALYRVLVQQARARILRKLADQTAATWELLDHFHRELWEIKQSTGGLRFGDVTQAIVEALDRKSLQAGDLAFRLDGAVDHLLLDEFQDTSLAQWRVMEPIARRITRDSANPPRSFFCVGDIKQAIYGWRGGMAEILRTLQDVLGPLKESPLVESRRSAPPIIDVVNLVFGNLDKFPAGDKYQDAVMEWRGRFKKHTTIRRADSGYVCLHCGPQRAEGQDTNAQRGEHCKYVAEQLRDLLALVPGRRIGVLCRKRETVARMIYELRRCKVQASEEAGNPLTDSPAVEVLLSLFTLADHPGHTVAWFHLKNSPLQKHLDSFPGADSLSARLRRDLLERGYGEFTQFWAKSLAPECDLRDLGRLQQLVEAAYSYQARSTLRADDFVTWVRQLPMPDPSGAEVRVMTIHAAKGLEFDIVFLPDLDAALHGQTPAFVVGRDARLDVNFVCRYAEDAVQRLLEPGERSAFDQYRKQCAEESLALLYVALTRAVHALYLYIPGPGRRPENDAWYNLLLATLTPGKPLTANALLYEHGDADWYLRTPTPVPAAATPEAERLVAITFRGPGIERRRGLEHVAPSRREGHGRVVLERVFHPSEGTGTAAGTLYHAWFAMIGWLEDGIPTEADLRSAANRLRADLPEETWRDLDHLLANFRAWLQNSVINAVLRRSSYTDPSRSAFPAVLAPLMAPTIGPQQVERERRFLVRDGTRFWNGSCDRVVWLGDCDRTVAADVLDFKTDKIEPGDAAGLANRVEHYRPQLEAYRRAMAQLARLPEKRIATRLVFTFAGRIVEM